MGFLEWNEICHLPNRGNNGKGVPGNAAALQHSFKVALLSQLTDNYQFSPGMYLHSKLTITTMSVANLQSCNLLCLCWLVLIWKQPPPKPFPAESVWVFPTAGITFALCWRLCLNLSSSLPPSSHMNSVVFRALDDHQGKNKIWWIRTFFFAGTFFPGENWSLYEGDSVILQILICCLFFR